MKKPKKLGEIEITKEEILYVTLFSLITGFVLSYNDWGYKTFNLLIGLKNFATSVTISFIGFSITIILLKKSAINLGSKLKIKFNIIGSLIGFLIDFIFYAIIPIPAFIDFEFESDEKTTYGHPRIMFPFEYSYKICLYFFIISFIYTIIAYIFLKTPYVLKYFSSLLFFALPIPKVPGFYFMMLGKEKLKDAIKVYFLLLITALTIYIFFKMKI